MSRINTMTTIFAIGASREKATSQRAKKDELETCAKI